MKKVVRESARKCREDGVEASSELLAYVAMMMEVKQQWKMVLPGASLKDELGNDQAAVLGGALAQQARELGPCWRALLDLQVEMEEAFQHHREALQSEMQSRQHNQDEKMRALCSTKISKSPTISEYEKLQQCLLEYVLSAGNMSRALGDNKAMSLVRAAMDSAMPISTLARYVTLPSDDKQQQARELAAITTGICLAQRASGQTDFDVVTPVAYDLLDKALRLQGELAQTLSTFYKHATALSGYLQHLQGGGGGDTHQDGGDAELQQCLVWLTQCWVHLSDMMDDLQAGRQVAEQLTEQWDKSLEKVVQLTSAHSALPRDQIFPQLAQLASIHDALLEEQRLQGVREELYHQLLAMTQDHGILQHLQQYDLGEEATARTEEGDSSAEAIVKDLPEGYSHDWEAVDSSSGKPLLVSLSSCCPVLLAQQGLPVPANTGLGYIRYKGNLYGFSSVAAMRTFVTSTGDVLSSMLRRVAASPELVHPLRLQYCFQAVSLIQAIAIMAAPTTCDFGTQTDVHPVEKCIDRDYEWNEWTLRRRVIQLANLRRCATHSTQTTLSHFRRDGETQVWRPKLVDTQTSVHKGQSMPKKVQYVAGLRGAPEVKMKVVNLDLDLGQPHQY